MKKIHLDTCFLIRALVPGSPEDKSLRQWLETRIPIGVSVVAWAEFLCGPVTDSELELSRLLIGSPLPLTEVDAHKAAEFFNMSGRRRGVFAGCLIAATTVREHAILATGNPKDFQGLADGGLDIFVCGTKSPAVH